MIISHLLSDHSHWLNDSGSSILSWWCHIVAEWRCSEFLYVVGWNFPISSAGPSTNHLSWKHHTSFRSTLGDNLQFPTCFWSAPCLPHHFPSSFLSTWVDSPLLWPAFQKGASPHPLASQLWLWPFGHWTREYRVHTRHSRGGVPGVPTRRSNMERVWRFLTGVLYEKRNGNKQVIKWY